MGDGFTTPFDVLKRFTPPMTVMIPTVEDLREKLPVLQSASDEAIRSRMIDLSVAATAYERCGACTGFVNCWRSGDGAGMLESIRVDVDAIVISTSECKPSRDFRSQKRQKNLQEASGMTSVDRGFTFATYPVDQARKHLPLWNRMRKFADEYQAGQQGKGVYIFGPTGIGKTHMELALVNRLEERDIPVIWIRADDLVGRLRDAKLRGDAEYERMVRLYAEVDVLVIDEIGQRGKTDFPPEALIDVLDPRAAASRPTFFTSNLQPNEIYEHLCRDVRATRMVEALRSRIAAVADAAMMIGLDHRVASMDVLMPVQGASQ